LKAILQSAGPAQSGQFLEFNGSSAVNPLYRGEKIARHRLFSSGQA
jgi:hypothetical protein